MNKGQEHFFNYILECCAQDKQEEAKALLHDSFKRQEEGNFSKSDLEKFHTEIVKILKSDRKDEVIAIMNQFGNSHVSE